MIGSADSGMDDIEEMVAIVTDSGTPVSTTPQIMATDEVVLDMNEELHEGKFVNDVFYSNK